MVNMAINNLKAKVVSVILVSVFLNQLTPANVIAAGRANAATTNTIRSGNGVPAVSLGIDGDFYIDLKTMNFYGPKANKHWPIPTSLRGPTGAAGPSGVDGKNGTTASATAGAAGATGPAGPAGPKGDTGATGAKGETGAAGVAGTGSAGPKGDTGAQGPAGPKGDAGAAGPIQSVTLTQWTLASGTIGGGSESASFGNLLAGKKYFFSIAISGRMAIDVANFRSSPELKCSDGAASIIYDYSYGFEPSFDGTGEYNRMSYMIVGTVSVASNSALSVVVKDGRGTGKTVTLNGTAVIQEVGSIN
jgi:hypothetical protein